MKNLVPHCLSEWLALSLSTLVIVAWAISWWQG